jgi:hypothetical protein
MDTHAPQPCADPAGAGSMGASAPYLLATVAALYAGYLGIYFVLGAAVFSAGNYFWHEAVVIVLAAAAQAHAGLRSAAPMRRFLLGNAALLLLLVLTDASYRRDLPVWRDAQGGALQLTDAAYAAFLFAWVCAWSLLAIALARRQRPGGRTVAVFALLMAGFVGLFAAFYAPLYHGGLGELQGRVNVIVAVLELGAVVAGMAVMLLGAGNALVLLVFGITLLAASDMLYSEAAVLHQGFAAADPVWMLGLCLLLAGALILPRGRGLDDAQDAAAGSGRRSGLSTVLLALSLGAVLLSAAVSLLLRRGADGHAVPPPVGEPFFYVLFVVVLVVVMVWLTDRFDRAVRHAGRHAVQLLGGGLQAPDWREEDRRLAWILDATGLGQWLDGLHRAAARLREDVLFLGPERLNPPVQAGAAGAAPTCFIVMPFGQPDSAAVHHVLREACLQAGLHPLRGDDLFTPTDILDDIWRGITGAHCVIADITGRNPNVLYELGMAHTLAKPVLILSRRAEDIPIDLATRRVIVYGPADGGDWQATLASSVQAALQTLIREYPLPAPTALPRTAAIPGAPG